MTSVALGARRLVEATRHARHAKYRRPPRLRLGDSVLAPPRVYYLSPDPRQPRGGVRVFYRHVDLLNDAGIPATVVHSRPGYRARWFANETRVAAARDVTVNPQDVLVVPEVFGANLRMLPRGPRIVIFNQAAYHTFDGMSPADVSTYGTAPIAGILTVSDDSRSLIHYTFPDVPVHIARSVIDGAIFHPNPDTTRPRRVAYAPSRRAQERDQLLSILLVRGSLAGWELVPVTGMSERQVAETLRTSPIFLSFSKQEGFGLPPAEAMASGCYVVGYHGQGGREFFDPEYCSPVPDGDLLAFVRAVESAAESYDADPGALTTAGVAASRAVLERYSQEGLRDDLLGVFASLGLAAAPRGADGH